MTHPILTRNNHELMKAVRASVKAGAPMAAIAESLGVEVNDLCNWVLDVYREPPRVVAKERGTLPEAQPMAVDWSASKQAQRFAAWRRAKAAATVALKGAQ